MLPECSLLPFLILILFSSPSTQHETRYNLTERKGPTPPGSPMDPRRKVIKAAQSASEPRHYCPKIRVVDLPLCRLTISQCRNYCSHDKIKIEEGRKTIRRIVHQARTRPSSVSSERAALSGTTTQSVSASSASSASLTSSQQYLSLAGVVFYDKFPLEDLSSSQMWTSQVKLQRKGIVRTPRVEEPFTPRTLLEYRLPKRDAETEKTVIPPAPPPKMEYQIVIPSHTDNCQV